MYFSQYMLAEQKLSPIVMGAVLVWVAMMAVLTHKTLTRTRFLLVGNELSEFDPRGRLVRTISIDDETSILLKPDPTYKRRTICEVRKGADLISVNSDLHRWEGFLSELGKVRPVERDLSGKTLHSN